MPKMLAPPTDVCKVWACRFQKCMRETVFDMDRCSWEVEALKKCCDDHQANGKSLHCAFAPRTPAEDPSRSAPGSVGLTTKTSE